MRQVSFASIIAQGRQWTDTVGAQDPQDSEIANFVGQSFCDWYDKVTDAAESDYWFAQQLISTVSGQNNYTLPIDLSRIRRVDSQVGNAAPGNQRWVSVRRFDEAMQNTFGALFGGPIMPGGQIIRVSYLPVAPFPQQYATLTLYSADGIDGIVFTANQGGSPGTNVSVQIVAGGGGATTVAAPVSPYAIVITLKSGGDTIVNILAALNVNTSVALQVLSAASLTPLQTDSFTAAVSAVNLGGTLQWDFINGWDRWLVADTAAFIQRRLKLDDGPFIAERERLTPGLSVKAAKRDENEPQQAKDVMRARVLERGPFFSVYPYRFGYRVYAQNLYLLPFVA